MDWFLRQPPEGMPGWMTVEEFLWRDPSQVGAPPPLLTWYAPFTGHVFMRSAWNNDGGQLDSSATYISFNAGDRLAYHQFYDQGSFTIFHNGNDLVVRSGVYSGDGTSDHDANYYARTIAANTILVCDLAENFDGIRPNGERDIWLNDCGQRTMSPASRTAINMDNLLENWRAYDTGSIVRLGDVGDVTYIRADITGAYNSTVYTTPENRAKVSLVQRELVYWRPGLVLVHDRVTTTYPAYTPMMVFHFQTEPTPSGLFYGSLVNDSALYLQNMLPNSRVTVVSGYQVAGQTIDRSWGEPVKNNFENLPYGF
jgi:heparin/heparan-sulfate lyase